MTKAITLSDWIGRSQVMTDTLRPQPARFLQATLDREPDLSDGDALPPLWHWLYFLEAAKACDLGRDAHPKKGGFLPPVPLPRRMWAGGRFSFDRPLVLGRETQKRSTITAISEKEGRTGPLCFVTVRHVLSQGGLDLLTEEHDIVYRNDPAPGMPAPTPRQAPQGAEFAREITPNEALLFRYSALTFNGHRIHYDADYARDVEGYEGLVFHGPLTATLLLDLAMTQTRDMPRRFTFRGLAPIAGLRPFLIEGRREGAAITLWARRADGALAMTAEAVF